MRGLATGSATLTESDPQDSFEETRSNAPITPPPTAGFHPSDRGFASIYELPRDQRRQQPHASLQDRPFCSDASMERLTRAFRSLEPSPSLNSSAHILDIGQGSQSCGSGDTHCTPEPSPLLLNCSPANSSTNSSFFSLPNTPTRRRSSEVTPTDVTFHIDQPLEQPKYLPHHFGNNAHSRSYAAHLNYEERLTKMTENPPIQEGACTTPAVPRGHQRFQSLPLRPTPDSFANREESSSSYSHQGILSPPYPLPEMAVQPSMGQRLSDSYHVEANPTHMRNLLPPGLTSSIQSPTPFLAMKNHTGNTRHGRLANEQVMHSFTEPRQEYWKRNTQPDDVLAGKRSQRIHPGLVANANFGYSTPTAFSGRDIWNRTEATSSSPATPTPILSTGATFGLNGTQDDAHRSQLTGAFNPPSTASPASPLTVPSNGTSSMPSMCAKNALPSAPNGKMSYHHLYAPLPQALPIAVPPVIRLAPTSYLTSLPSNTSWNTGNVKLHDGTISKSECQNSAPSTFSDAISKLGSVGRHNNNKQREQQATRYSDSSRHKNPLATWEMMPKPAKQEETPVKNLSASRLVHARTLSPPPTQLAPRVRAINQLRHNGNGSQNRTADDQVFCLGDDDDEDDYPAFEDERQASKRGERRSRGRDGKAYASGERHQGNSTNNGAPRPKPHVDTYLSQVVMDDLCERSLQKSQLKLRYRRRWRALSVIMHRGEREVAWPLADVSKIVVNEDAAHVVVTLRPGFRRAYRINPRGPGAAFLPISSDVTGGALDRSAGALLLVAHPAVSRRHLRRLAVLLAEEDAQVEIHSFSDLIRGGISGVQHAGDPSWAKFYIEALVRSVAPEIPCVFTDPLHPPNPTLPPSPAFNQASKKRRWVLHRLTDLGFALQLLRHLPKSASAAVWQEMYDLVVCGSDKFGEVVSEEVQRWNRKVEALLLPDDYKLSVPSHTKRVEDVDKRECVLRKDDRDEFADENARRNGVVFNSDGGKEPVSPGFQSAMTESGMSASDAGGGGEHLEADVKVRSHLLMSWLSHLRFVLVAIARTDPSAVEAAWTSMYETEMSMEY